MYQEVKSALENRLNVCSVKNLSVVPVFVNDLPSKVQINLGAPDFMDTESGAHCSCERR